MKMVLSLQHEHLPKTLHAEHPSEQIEWEGSGLSLLQEARAWRRDASRVRRAGVSSFGISGTNVHVVLEEAPARAVGSSSETNGAVVAEAATRSVLIPLLVSGRDEAALRAQAGRYADWLSAHRDVDWDDVLSTAALHRTHFAARASVSARDAAEATAALRALSEGRSHAAVSEGEAQDERGGKLAFLFTGQGAQQLGMGRGLAESCPVFPRSVRRSLRPLRRIAGYAALRRAVRGGGLRAGREVGRDGIYAAGTVCGGGGAIPSVGVVGVHPDVLLGHSIGELAAAHVAGVWSLRDACRVVAARGRLMQALPAGGAMVALEASEAEVLPRLEQYAGWRLRD
jgi:acyl transferase domain-containing protein